MNLAIIPARKNSKRLPGKNMRMLAGKPMVQWTIEAALQAESITAVLVTSDDEKVLQLARSLGVQLVIERPAHLCEDDSTTTAVLLHALESAQLQGVDSLSFTLLQPTSPLRIHHDIDAACTLHTQRALKPVISVCELDHPLQWCAPLGAELSMSNFAANLKQAKRSQEYEKNYRINGAVYVTQAAEFKQNNGFSYEDAAAYVMHKRHSVDVDDDFDFKFAEYLISARAAG